MTALPPQVPNRLRDDAHAVSAYNICLGVQRSLQEAVDGGKDVGNNMIYIRILGYLIHYVPTTGLKTVVYEIVSCPGNDALFNVGKMYYDHYIRARTFRRSTYSMCHLTR